MANDTLPPVSILNPNWKEYHQLTACVVVNGVTSTVEVRRVSETLTQAADQLRYTV
jgi:hypothetical protein